MLFHRAPQGVIGRTRIFGVSFWPPSPGSAVASTFVPVPCLSLGAEGSPALLPGCRVSTPPPMLAVAPLLSW